ncbi:MAG TPA: hypothetical protein VK961_07595 [Chthoniobacter sp.]|nr:hypothetical protein [Chthoniobacter sp.]
MPTVRLNPSPKSHPHHQVSHRMHGILDYVGGVLLLLSAIFLPFPDSAMRMLGAAFGVILLLYSAATDYEMGLLRFVPFPIHRGADLVLGIALAFSPIHFAVHGGPVLLFIAVGAMLIFLAFMTRGESSHTGVDKQLFPGG